jgi:hypothetical protein
MFYFLCCQILVKWHPFLFHPSLCFPLLSENILNTKISYPYIAPNSSISSHISPPIIKECFKLYCEQLRNRYEYFKILVDKGAHSQNTKLPVGILFSLVLIMKATEQFWFQAFTVVHYWCWSCSWLFAPSVSGLCCRRSGGTCSLHFQSQSSRSSKIK